MKQPPVRLLFATAFCLLSFKLAFGCAVITVPLLTKFDPAEYIFIGEVIGLAESIESEKFHGKAAGLKVVVKDSLNLPRSQAKHFVIVPFELASDCKDQGRSEEELLRYFPVGSEVRVIAKESKYAPSQMADGNIRLEVLPHNLGSVARNYSPLGRPITSIRSIYDYRTYEQGNPCGNTEKAMPDYEGNMRLPDFEYRKDLKRLKNSRSQKARIEILERLTYSSILDQEFFEIMRQHLQNRETRGRLKKERESWRRLFLSKVVVSC